MAGIPEELVEQEARHHLVGPGGAGGAPHHAHQLRVHREHWELRLLQQTFK